MRRIELKLSFTDDDGTTREESHIVETSYKPERPASTDLLLISRGNLRTSPSTSTFRTRKRSGLTLASQVMGAEGIILALATASPVILLVPGDARS